MAAKQHPTCYFENCWMQFVVAVTCAKVFGLGKALLIVGLGFVFTFMVALLNPKAFDD